MNIISVDIGTSSLRTVLYTSQGDKLHEVTQEYTSEYFGAGYVEQNPTTWKMALMGCLTGLAGWMEEHGKGAKAIAVTSQRSSLIAMDRENHRLHNAIMWQDKRSLPQCEALLADIGLKTLYRKTGLRINPYFVLPKILWLKENKPALHAKGAKFVGVQDYVVYHLTDTWKTDFSQACRTLLMDISTFRWDDDLLAAGGLTADQLPELVAPGSVAGTLTSAMAKATGLPSGLPVILAGGDQQNAALAMGVLAPGKAEANTGTGSFVISATDSPMFDEKCRILCQASAIPGKWILEAGIFNTGAIYRWCRNEFYKDYTCSDAYHFMNKGAMKEAVGSGGVTLMPHFEGSAAPWWNPLAKGMFFNLSLGTKREQLARAVLEGIALEIDENLELMESLIGRIDEVNVAGGLTKSELFCTIQASAYNRRVIRHANTEASSLGSVMNALVGLGVYPDLESAYQTMVSGERLVFEPETDAVRRYGQVRRLKQRLYHTLNDSGLYEEFIQPLH